MSWTGFFSRSSSGATSSSPSAIVPHAHRQRMKQIENLREQVNGVVEEAKDLRYRVHFMAGGNDFHLKIELPPGFPKDAPVVSVHPPCRHAWLDSEGRVVGCPALKNYNLHENMGKVIKQILDELSSSPPQPIVQAPLQNVPSGVPYPTQGDFPIAFPTLQMNSFEPRRPPPPPPHTGRRRYQAPPVPDSFPEIEDKSNEELQELLAEEGIVLVNQIVERHPVMEKFRVDRECLMAEIESQAEANLRHEPELQEGYELLQRCYGDLGNLKSRFDRAYAVQNEKLARCTAANASTKLAKLSTEAETDAEKHGEAFLEGNVLVTEFIKSFKQQQKLHHIRQAKASMLSDSSSKRPPPPVPWSPY